MYPTSDKTQIINEVSPPKVDSPSKVFTKSALLNQKKVSNYSTISIKNLQFGSSKETILLNGISRFLKNS